jgi:Holliday junction resolvase RusA-like endonuclease
MIYGAALSAIKAATGAEDPFGWDGPVVVELAFFFAIPPSWPKWRREYAAQGSGHTSKPDLDNLAKAVLDGVGNLFWKDDAQVSAVTARKAYTTGPERTEAKIWRRISA